MIDIKSLTVNYEKKTALKNFSLSIKENEIVAIVGESGSGKTTVLRTILNILPQNSQIISGKIYFQNKSLLDLNLNDWQNLRGNEIAIIFQDTGNMLNPVRTIGSQFIEYIKAHSKLSKKEALNLSKQMLKKMNLQNVENILKSYPFELSGGQCQRIGIAMAMTFKPKLLLADEPTSALDANTQAQIVQELLKLHDEYKTTILMITHNLAVANYMADRILIMKDGEIIDFVDKNKLFNSKNEYTKELINSIPNLKGKRYV